MTDVTQVDTYDVTNPAKPTIVKDPDAILDYSQDWTSWLADETDTIVAATMVFPTVGTLLTLDPAHSAAIVTGGTVVTAWLKGGNPGTTEQATFHITTAAGRVDDRSIFLKIKDR